MRRSSPEVHLRAAAVVVGSALVLSGCASTPERVTGQVSAEAELLLGESFETSAGESVKLSDLPGLAGQVVLVDFFATWCLPCADSLPVYERWVRDLGHRGFIVVAVSEDEPREPVPDFMKRHAPSVRVLFDAGGRVAERLRLPGMPTAFLLDREGRLLRRHEGFRPGDESELGRIIEQALGPR